MALSIPVTWSDAHRLHAPESAVWIGVPIPADELPERADSIRQELEDAGAEIVEAEAHDDDVLLDVHDPGLVEFLRSAWERWDGAGLRDDPGQADVIGYIFPTPGLLAGLEPRVPTALPARTGAWCYDTMTVVAEGTWDAARAAVDTALTAADLVLGGTQAAYACCSAARASRHEVGVRRLVLPEQRRDRGAVPRRARRLPRRRCSTSTRTTETERRRSSGTARTSLPHRCTSIRRKAGSRTSSDSPTSRSTRTSTCRLRPARADDVWLDGVAALVAAAREHASEALVVALGVDAAAGDPNAPLAVSEAGFREAGRRLGALRLPTVLVQEGGYVPESIGPLVRTTLEGFEDGSR